ncbi:LamG domain-containing protein [Streptomyces marispadix]|uniref:LamG domain-containing protein n=1 Tax=Streptomyces marispadix TaxID=2922868 RepID=A0ABS9SY91_9ACTN|nr:LamG domain-containing protein [Streptomyces marispadix]MCH6161031.1 LamG domain-containing protein [Streptomyces marispadix]
METECVSDAGLVELVRGGGESAGAALAELERRHFDAVRAFAAICLNDVSAVEELARRAWQSAAAEGGITAGAVRPQALALVLWAAAGVAETGHRAVLEADLAVWLAARPQPQTSYEEPDGQGGAAFLHQGSVTARAFNSLPPNLQTVLWHHLVERADSDAIAPLLGSGSSESQEVSVLIRRAHRDFYYAYEQIHQYGMADDCRRFHRVVMAYADGRGGNTGDVVEHLAKCGYCARAVADLERMHSDFGGLLVQALLPWGGPQYAESRRGEWASTTIEIPVIGREGGRESGRESGREGGRGGRRGGGRERHRRGAAAATSASSAAPAGPSPTAGLSPTAGPSPEAGPVPPVGPPPTAPPLAPPARARGRERTGGRDRIRGRDRMRGRRVTQVAAAVGVCSAAVAFAYAQGVGTKLSELAGVVPSKETPSTSQPRDPGPSKSASNSPSPSPSRSGGGDFAPPGDEGRDRRPSPTPSPAVKGAALEWLFGDDKDADGPVAADSSGNGKNGTPKGDPLPKPLADGGLAFFGQQSVTSRGPVLDTDRSFSVSARVKLSNTDEYQTVASQDGTEISSFQLQYDAVENRWEMRMHQADSRTSPADEAESDSAPRAGRWTSLTGVWDASDERIRLYVDGELEDSVGRDGDSSTEGEFAVGRAQLGEGFIRGLEGTVAGVRAYPRALTGAEARKLADEDAWNG